MSAARLSITHGPAEPALVRWTFNDVIRNRLRDHPDEVVVYSQHQNQALTYKELNTLATKLAAGLCDLGVSRGERVGVLLSNRSEYAVIMLACSKLGAYFTLFNYAYTAAELLATVKATTPRVLLTTLSTSRFDYRCVLDEIVRQTPELERVILLDDASVAFEVKEKYIQDGTNRFLEYSKMLKSGRSRSSLTNTGPEEMDTDILNLQFTSGSTGTPKVAALTHHGMVNSAIYMGQTMTLTSSDKIVVPVPLFHAFGLIMGLCTAMLYGASIILPSEYFNTEDTLRAVERYESTGLFGVTTMFVDMLSHEKLSTTKRSSLRFSLLSGSALPDGLLARIKERFSIRDIYTNWGMTELSSVVTMTRASDPPEKKRTSAGRLLPNFAAKIVDPNTGTTVPWGQRGEIIISGFGVMHSYYGQPDRTAQAIRKYEGDDRRWMHTGDEGYLDKDGYFVITGRIKDLIIRGGENISPIEIESRLYEHPAIKQCAVFAVPSARYGEEVAAMLELNEAEPRPSNKEIRSFIIKELARYKAPKHIWWLGDAAAGVPCEWPKTANGKLRKADIRMIGKELLERGAYGQTEIAASI